MIGDTEYLEKGGIVLDIYDSDNSPSDNYMDDCFEDLNEEYSKVTAEPTIGLPRIRETNPNHSEPQRKQIIKRHIPHEQEVESFKHDYTINLEGDLAICDASEIPQYLIASKLFIYYRIHFNISPSFIKLFLQRTSSRTIIGATKEGKSKLSTMARGKSKG